MKQEKTRALLVSRLREGPKGVGELASALGLTKNAVRFHLSALESAGTITRSGSRKPQGAGKPAVLYTTSAAADASFSRAYAPVLAACVEEIAEEDPAGKNRFMRRVGRRLARGVPKLEGPLSARVAAASNFLNTLGGMTRVRREKDAYVIQGKGCPVSGAVEADECVCVAIESLLCDVLDAKVTERCVRGGKPNCCFQVTERTTLKRKIA